MTDFQLKEKAKLEEQKKKDELEALLAKASACKSSARLSLDLNAMLSVSFF